MEHYQAAVNAHRDNDLPLALKLYGAALAIHDAIPAIHNNVAAIHLAQGTTKEAEASWRRALEHKPDYAEAHYNLAVLLSERDEAFLDEAAEHCTLALKHKEDYVQAHHLMGNILASQKRDDAARHAYATAEAVAAAGQLSGEALPTAAQLPVGAQLTRIPSSSST
jgi:tetratricopeptide (TPR) repeat protein